MQRQPIDGGWFDIDAATCYEEGTEWDGRNQISRATGDQWEHEELYLTRRGVYVLHHWSQWQGSRDTWSRLDAEDAAQWLAANGHDETGIAAVDAAIAALEV